MIAASINSPVEIFDLTRKKLAKLNVTKKIGEGSFGKAYLVKSSDYQEHLVCKEIELQSKSLYIHYSPYQLLRLTYREIHYLQQLGLLVGYQHDKKNQKILIVMKYLPGIEEHRIDPKLKRLAEYASFCALRGLHRKGIAHMDPHEGNFLYDKKSDSAQAIDFGLAQNAQFFRNLRDFHVFLKVRRSAPSFLSAKGRETLWYFIDFYCNELKDHILKHQYQTAQTLFCYAAVIIAALCGASVFGVASILAQELIKAAILPSLSQVLMALQDHYELRAFNNKNEATYRFFYYCLAGTMIVLQGFILALQVIALQNCATTFFTQISSFGTACANSQFFWQTCINTFPVEDAVKTVIQLQPLSDTIQYWYLNAEKYLLSSELLTSHYQSKINTFVPMFKNATSMKQNVPTQQTVSNIPTAKCR